MRTTAVAQKAMEELNQAMMETEIKNETKDAIIESTIKNVTNLEVQIALGIAKTKETNKNIEAIGEQLEALKKDVITRRITADAEKNLKAQNVEIGANEIVRTTDVAQKAMEELNQAMIETEIKKETKDANIS